MFLKFWMCMSVLPTCMFVLPCVCWGLQRLEEASDSLDWSYSSRGTVGSCETPFGCWKEPRSSEEQQVLRVLSHWATSPDPLFLFLNYVCIWVWGLQMWVQYPWWPEEGVRTPGTWVIWLGWWENSCPLQEQCALNTESHLRSPINNS